MEKSRKKIILVILTFIICFLVGFIVKNPVSTIMASDFEIEKTKVYEDFMKDDDEIEKIISNEINIDKGENPHLRIASDEEYKQSVVVYEQYLNTKNYYQDRSGDNVLVIKMRGTNIILNNLQLRIGINEDNTKQSKEYQLSPSKKFTELKDRFGVSLSEITEEYATYVIDIHNSFSDNDVYKRIQSYISDNPLKVRDNPICSIELRFVNVKEFALDIAEIYTYKSDNVENIHVWNNFIGSENVKITANKDSSSVETMGTITRRNITMSPESTFEVSHFDEFGEIIPENVRFLHVDAVGDVDNLTIMIAREPNIFGTDIDYIDYIQVDGIIYAIKLSYNGTQSVKISEIYFTDHSSDDIMTQVPLIIYGSEEKGFFSLDKFNAEQSTFEINKQYAALRQSNIFSQTNAEYRYSTTYKTGMLEIVNSVLKINSTNNVNGNTTYNFSAKYLLKNSSAKDYKYLVMKAKFSGLANVENMSLCFDENKISDVTNYKRYLDFYCGYGMRSPLANSTNPYDFNNGYYFLIIDLDESGIQRGQDFFISINYNGQGEVYIDELFLTNKQDNVIINEKLFDNSYNIYFEVPTLMEKNLDIKTSNYDYLEFSVRLNANMKEMDDNGNYTRNKFSSVKFTFDNKVLTLDELYNSSGIKLSNIFTANMNITQQRTVKIDLKKSNIQNTSDLNIKFEGEESGTFSLSQFRLTKEISYRDYKVIKTSSTHKITDKLNIGTAFDLKYTENTERYVILQMTIDSYTDDLSGLVFDFDGRKFYAHDGENLNQITLLNGIYLKDYVFHSPETLYIDLSLMGINNARDFTIYIEDEQLNGTQFKNFYFGEYETIYGYIMSLSNKELASEKKADVTIPVLEVNWPTGSVTEQNLSISFSYYDTQTDLSNLELSVTLKKGSSDVEYEIQNTLEQNENGFLKSFNDLVFNATAGLYDITLTITDEAGNSITRNHKVRVVEPSKPEPIKKFDWKIVLYITVSILLLATLVFGIIFLIKFIQGKDTRIKFN